MIQEMKDVEEAGPETEQEGLPLGVTTPERKPDEIEEVEELDRDVNETGGFIEPESSSRDEKSLLETEAQVEHLEDVENQTLECVELKDESDAKETDEINTFENLNTPESQKESSCSLAELLPESSKDKSEEDSSPPDSRAVMKRMVKMMKGNLLISTTSMSRQLLKPIKLRTRKSRRELKPCQIQVKIHKCESTERHDEASGLDEPEQVESEPARQATAHQARLSTAEGAVLNVGGSSAAVAEDVNQTTSSPVEEGSVQPELSPVHVARDKEPPHSGKGERKNSKKGKGKGKEDSPSHLTISLVLPTPEIRLRKLVDEREKMIEQVKKLKAQLEQKSPKNGTDSGSSPDGEVLENGNDPNILEVQRDSSRQMSDLKFKLVKAEQEVTALEQNVTRLEGQVTRYKSAAENAEKGGGRAEGGEAEAPERAAVVPGQG
ncbi:unnamed protein product [Pleuronectes platessa]|uniref:Uncharacterized protein n=1 Tax=Pleuronectes platessa TaxID=8262 RepID=A0A9N7TNS8_PLEPL|nr:unnamed protein product [Pleuronectes platessa]